VIGGWTDLLVMRFIDIMMAFPAILMALVVVAVLRAGDGERDARRGRVLDPDLRAARPR